MEIDSLSLSSRFDPDFSEWVGIQLGRHFFDFFSSTSPSFLPPMVCRWPFSRPERFPNLDSIRDMEPVRPLIAREKSWNKNDCGKNQGKHTSLPPPKSNNACFPPPESSYFLLFLPIGIKLCD